MARRTRGAALLRTAFWVRWLVPVLLLATVVHGCTTGINPVSGNRRALAYSWEQELELGKQADQQIVQQFGLYDNEEVQQYVERLGQDILEESHMRRPDTREEFRNTEFTFRVLDSPVVNAFALPGGYVYVTRGLLAHLNNEAQLAVVLGHEIAHVAARHASQQAARQQLTQLGLIAGAIGGELAGLPGGDILQLGSQATQLLFLRYSRDNERESDNLGVEYAAMNGYAVGEAAGFFESLERLQEQSGGGLPTWQSSHPDPGAREQEMRELAEAGREELGRPLDKVERDVYYSTIENIVLGDNPRQGFTRDDMFYHPDLQFQFPVPPRFEVVNQPTAVLMVGPEQEAIVQFTVSEENSPRAAAAQLTENQGIRVVQQGEVRAGGLPAFQVEALAQTQQGQQLRLLAHYVEYEGRVYEFIGYTLADNFDAYRSAFLQTMRGFAPLNDPEILDVEPTRLVVRPAERTAPFRDLVPADLPEGFSEEGLAILNQVELDEQIEQGRPLKLPAE